MKVEELVVGEDYLMGTHHTWDQDHYRNERVRVLDTQMWEEYPALSGNRPGTTGTLTPEQVRAGDFAAPSGVRRIISTSGKPRVLVAIMRDHEGDEVRQIVSVLPRYIRVPWAEGLQITQNWREAQRERHMKSIQKDLDRRQREEALKARADRIGLKVEVFGSVRIQPDEFERLLDHMEALHLTFEQEVGS